MAFRMDGPYYLIPGSQPGGTFGAVLEILLKTRLKLHMDTHEELYDEDVNTYLSGVLVSYIDPVYLLTISELLSKYDTDVHQAAREAWGDRVHTYWIYKVNADDRLISLGIFRRMWKEQMGEVGRVQHYYSCASACQRRIYGKPTAVGEIQAKLAEATERYLTILSEARAEYLHFVRQVGTAELKELADRVGEDLAVKSKWDELLDAYSAWVQEPGNLPARSRLLELIEDLKRLDPGFDPKQIFSRIPPA